MSDTLRRFWSKSKATGAAIKAPLKAADQLKKLKGVNGAQQLATLVGVYEAIDPLTDPTCSARMKALSDIDAAIYAWFAHSSVPSIAGLKGAKEFSALLKKSEQAHEQLVAATKTDPNVIPFDTTGLAPNEVADRKAVWRGIMDGTSQIELGGSDKFQKKTAAQLAKMLQTGTGFDILNYLSTPKSTAPGADDRVVLGDKLPPDLQNVAHLKAGNAPVSYAQRLSPSDTLIDMPPGVAPTGNENPADFPTLAKTADLQKAIFAGAKGVIVGGMKYVFPAGCGAFVQTVPPRAGDEDSDTAGHGNSEIITPAFVTLAHELGHAVNIRAGAVSRPHAELMTELCKQADPSMTDVKVGDVWTNSEEYFVINNIENAIRKDAGLALRAAHKPRTALNKIALNESLFAQFSALMAKDDAVGLMPIYQDAAVFMNANKGNTTDDKVLADIAKTVRRLDAALSDNAIKKFKQDDLKNYHQRFEAAFRTIENSLDQNDPLVARFDAADARYTSGGDALTAVGTKNWQPLRSELRDARFAFAKVAAPQAAQATV